MTFQRSCYGPIARGSPPRWQRVALGAGEELHAHEGLDQSDLRAIIIESWRLDLDVEIDATDQGELFAFVRRRGATFCISRNGGAYHMSHGKGHVVGEADNIGEVLAALS